MVSYAADTHRGNVRKLNEDCYDADPELGLWLVADGVGGHASGDVASQLTRATIRSAYLESGDLVSAIESAHSEVLDAIARKEGGSNMGSTVVAAILKQRNYQIAWVGDSRAYAWNGTLRLLSKDHSFVEALVAKGVITRDEAFNHPKRNVITQSIGVSADDGLQVDTISGVLAKGEKLLLCSDGLNDELTDAAIANILSQYVSPKEQVHQLMQGALDNGGRDNITIIVIDPDEAQTVDLANDPQAQNLQEKNTEEDFDLDRHTIVMDKKSAILPEQSGLKNTVSKLLTSTKKLFK
jgi:protein phosphatase